jgi:predicted metalloprotease with PDZ domain
MRRIVRTLVLAWIVSASAAHASAQSAISYRLSFPEREHRIMNVEVTFPDLPPEPLRLHISRSSPGRYALHEFAKNVFDVRITDTSGQPLAVTRPSPHEWDVAMHPNSVRVTYRVFGDSIDGTYLAVDATHAHINMPAAIMWASGLELRPSVIRFEPPPGAGWRVATQLMPGNDPLTFTAPNLQYLMDSPAEVSAFVLRTFTIQDDARTPLFRVALHHRGADADVTPFLRDIERIVREERNVFGEYPAYEGNTYTFIIDYLPWSRSDGMEHRNSTIISSASSIRDDRKGLLRAIAHEFFHCWNVERIRPRSLEPFKFDDVNLSGELWLAEGFTNYYQRVALQRAGVTTVKEFADEIASTINTVLTSPGRLLRSAEEMSQGAAFADGARWTDPTNGNNTYISYYTWGEAIALGLDLTLRDRTNGRVTLDHFMRAMWQTSGKPGARLIGYVDRPYTIDEAKTVLASVSGDAMFADDFFARYIQGHDVVDYAALLARAGLVMRPAAAGQAYAGRFQLEDAGNGARVVGLVTAGSPAYKAGLDRDDVLVSVGGQTIRGVADLSKAIQSRKPGDMIPIVFVRRGERVSAVMTLGSDPFAEIVPAEQAGQPLTDAQKQFRDAWLNSPSRNVF